MSASRSSVRLALMIAAALVVAGAAQTSQQPAPPPAFRAGTSLVPLDVRVVDKKGHPVTDLTAADFTVVEDNVRQTIRHFSVQALTPDPAHDNQPLPRRAPRLTDLAPSRYRVFLIVLGRGDLQGVTNGVDGAIHFVRERLLPQDRVAVLAWNRATDFSADHTAALAVLDRFKKQYRHVEREIVDYFRSPASFYGDRKIPPSIQRDVDAVLTGPDHAPMRTVNAPLEGSADEERELREKYDLFSAPSSDRQSQMALDTLGISLAQFFDDTAQTLQDQANLYAGIEYLRHLEGEKHLIWITEYGLQRSFRDPVEHDRDLARTAADGRVVLDVIRTGGTVLSRGPGAAESRAPSRVVGVQASIPQLPAAASRMLADLTGGRSDANRFTHAADSLDLIDEASRVQYLLGYYPTNTRWDGRFRNVTVSADRPDLTVLTRRGYFARDESGSLDRRAVITYSRISAAAGDARPIADLRLAAAARRDDDGRGVTVTTTVDLSRVTFQKSNGRNTATLDVVIVALSPRQQPVGEVQRQLALTYSDDRLADARRDGVTVPLPVAVRAPAETMKLVVYDYEDDLTGSTNLTVGP